MDERISISMDKASKSYSTGPLDGELSHERIDSQVGLDNQKLRGSDNTLTHIGDEDTKDMDETSNNTYQISSVRESNAQKKSTKIFTANCKQLITGTLKSSIKKSKKEENRDIAYPQEIQKQQLNLERIDEDPIQIPQNLDSTYEGSQTLSTPEYVNPKTLYNRNGNNNNRNK